MGLAHTARRSTPGLPCRPDARRGRRPTPILARAAVPGLLAALVLAGCANPGPPRPPSLKLPEPVTDLLVRRVGDTLDLTWTTPSRSTDDLPLRPPLTGEVCEAAAAAANSVCRPALTLGVAPGPSHATLPLPPGTLSGQPALLVVRVRVRNSAGHSAEPSAPAFTSVGPAPPEVADLRANAMQGGARIEWTRVAGGAPLLLHRELLTPPPQTASQHPKPTNVDLQAADPGGGDPGGTLDRTAQEGDTYRYTAQRVRSLTLDGHPVQIFSAASAAVTVHIHDVFPPAPPTGLASVPGTPGEASASVELSWDPNSEPDLAGYLVERAELPSDTTAAASWTRLTPTPLAAPAFTDSTAAADHRYRYRIVAVDRSGNQSPPSTPIEETAAAP